MYARDVVEGRVIAHRDGYGFLARDDGGEDVFLPAREMRGLMHGDRVACEIRISRRGGRPGSHSGPRYRGLVLEIIERRHRVVVGRFFRAGGMSFVSPDHRNLPHDVSVADGEGADGEMVVVELDDRPPGERWSDGPAGRIVERLGDPERPGMAAEIAIRSHGIPHLWPEDALAEAKRLPPEVGDAAEVGGRADLRDLPLVTIDGVDARDFDDAVHCDPRPGGWKLTVAIADVSHYVPPGSALDREACLRGTSVYFPGRVVPMLPERLSNGICSLNPEVDRLCLACEMHVDRRGRVTRAFFRGAVMRSRARLTYAEVEAAVFDRDPGVRQRLGGLVPRLEALREVYAALRQARRRRGALDLELGEPRVVLGPGGEVARVEPAPRRFSHQLIEECMLAANVAAARRLARGRNPFLYRVHPPPDDEGLRELGAFLGRAGIDFDPGEEPRPGAFAEAAERAAGRPDTEILHLALLRAMAKADYRPRNIGHFGLALERYTHFTSPIRRYPDLLVHRALKGEVGGTWEEMATLGQSTSAAERRAEEASRDAVSRLVCQHLRSRVGEVFAGRITGVVSFGVFVRLDGLQVDGLAHVRSLGGDWYRFDRGGRYLKGETTGRRLTVGDAMTVRVTGADPDERRVHLEPIEPDGLPPRGEGGARRGARRGSGRSGGRGREPGPHPGGDRDRGRDRGKRRSRRF